MVSGSGRSTRKLEFWVVSVCEKKMGPLGGNLVLFSLLLSVFVGQGERETVLVLVFGWQGMEVVGRG